MLKKKKEPKALGHVSEKDISSTPGAVGMGRSRFETDLAVFIKKYGVLYIN